MSPGYRLGYRPLKVQFAKIRIKPCESVGENKTKKLCLNISSRSLLCKKLNIVPTFACFGSLLEGTRENKVVVIMNLEPERLNGIYVLV